MTYGRRTLTSTWGSRVDRQTHSRPLCTQGITIQKLSLQQFPFVVTLPNYEYLLWIIIDAMFFPIIGNFSEYVKGESNVLRKAFMIDRYNAGFCNKSFLSRILRWSPFDRQVKRSREELPPLTFKINMLAVYFLSSELLQPCTCKHDQIGQVYTWPHVIMQCNNLRAFKLNWKLGWFVSF